MLLDNEKGGGLHTMVAPSPTTLDEFKNQAEARGIHTVEVGTPDTVGHLRGKRVPIKRFIESVANRGVEIADGMFMFDIQNGLPEHPLASPDSGFADCKFVPDLSSARFLVHRPGYALVFCDVLGPDGSPFPYSPRTVLRHQVARCDELGLDPYVATELEFYLLNSDLTPIQSHIQYSSLTDGLGFESIIFEMRQAIAGAGIEVESSNAEYGPGQYEINCGPADALRTADNTVLFKSIVKQVAANYGLVASFMPKPFANRSGSGFHTHISLNVDGRNGFADSPHHPNELMGHWLAGQLKHAQALTLLGSPTPNGYKRMAPYTFAPTHIHWGGDNRTVLARCITEPDSSANRIEYRNGGADANPYLLVAGLLAAGIDGVKNKLELPPRSDGDMYANPGDCLPVPNTLEAAIAAFDGSELARDLGEVFSTGYVAIATAEAVLGSEQAPDRNVVVQWEIERYSEHS